MAMRDGGMLRFLLLIPLCVASGCRMYGDAGTKEAVIVQIVTSAEQVDRESVILQEDARRLGSAAELNDSLSPFAVRSAEIAEAHSALATRHAVLAEELRTDPGIKDNPILAWVGADRYRRLHRTFGAMTSERQALMDKRAMLARDLAIDAGIVVAVSRREEGRYQIAPQFYMGSHTVLDLTDVLARMGEVSP